jgi:hypothetical protein
MQQMKSDRIVPPHKICSDDSSGANNGGTRNALIRNGNYITDFALKAEGESVVMKQNLHPSTCSSTNDDNQKRTAVVCESSIN